MSLNLLPQERAQFASKEYWDDFFHKRGEKAFEWYGEYPQLCGILHKYITPKDSVMNIGCGNSRLSADIYDRGIEAIVNVDISEGVIARMKESNAKLRPNMKWEVGDVTNLAGHSDGSFSVALDKGTLDALFADTEADTVSTVRQMFAEISRVLKFGGRYLCLTLAQDFIAEELVNWFYQDKGWILRIQRVFDMEQGEDEHHMPLFAIVCTKFKRDAVAVNDTILEVAVNSEALERMKSVEDTLEAVKSVQAFAIVRHRMSMKEHKGDEIPLVLYTDDASSTCDTTSPRYAVFVVDVDDPKIARKRSFAVFIVPTGRETEWLFSTKQGRSQLGSSAGFSRLLVVLLHYDHQYRDLDFVKAELSAKVLELAPRDRSNKEVPFLSVDEDIGQRKILERGESKLSGKFVVDEVQINGHCSRRLIFSSNPHAVQSESRLVPAESSSKKKSGKKKKSSSASSSSSNLKIDDAFLTFEHSRVVVGALALLPRMEQLLKEKMETLLIGLGGGQMASFFHHHFPLLDMDAVEIDAAVLGVAKNHFALKTDSRLRSHVADGLIFLENIPQDKKYNVIILDCDNKDMSIGVSFPPPVFLSPTTLSHVFTALAPGGIFVINFGCRDPALRTSLLSNLDAAFSAPEGNSSLVWTKKLEECVNEIVVCLKTTNADDVIDDDKMKKHADLLKTIAPSIFKDDVLSEAFSKLSC